MLVIPQFGCDKEVFSGYATFLDGFADCLLGAVATVDFQRL